MKKAPARIAKKPAVNSNAAIQQRIAAAEANVRKAEAKKDLVIAQAEVKGKIVERQWDKPGEPYRVLDAPGPKR